jgi:hypothetical protein
MDCSLYEYTRNFSCYYIQWTSPCYCFAQHHYSLPPLHVRLSNYCKVEFAVLLQRWWSGVERVWVRSQGFTAYHRILSLLVHVAVYILYVVSVSCGKRNSSVGTFLGIHQLIYSILLAWHEQHSATIKVSQARVKYKPHSTVQRIRVFLFKYAV